MRSATLIETCSVSRPGVEPGPGPSESPVRSATPSGRYIRADDWIRTSIDPVYKTAASLFGHVGKHEREESNPVRRLWRLPALPGAHSCIGPRPCDRGPWRNDYSRSVTFQYASLTNFDQLSIRTLVVRVQRLPRRPDRLLAQPHPRLLRRPVGLPLVAGHARQHAVLPARHTTLRHAARRGRSSAPRCPAGHRSIGRCSGPA